MCICIHIVPCLEFRIVARIRDREDGKRENVISASRNTVGYFFFSLDGDPSRQRYIFFFFSLLNVRHV